MHFNNSKSERLNIKPVTADRTWQRTIY